MRIAHLVLLGIFLLASSATAKTTDEQQLLRKAGYVLQEVLESPDIEIPEALIKRAKAVIVFPTMIKGGFMIAARYGKGVVAVRSAKTGKFGPPAFVYTAGGSFGFQIGAQAVDLILLVMSPRGIEGLLKDKFTLGADAAVTAGPVGRHAEAGTDILMQGEIYSYSRSKGAFAGVSIKGAVITADRDSNWSYYNGPVTAEEILMTRKIKKLPESGKRYINTLNIMFPPKR
jgi:lipid-binding SYLF domain-containing protein